MVPALVIGGIALVCAIIGLNFYLTAKRRKAMAEWAGQNGMTFSDAYDYGIESRYSQYSALRQGSNRYAYNTMTGDYHGRAFEGFDYHYETYSTDNKGNRQTNHTYLSAIILQSEVPLKPLWIRAENFFDKIGQFAGFDDINFESAEFSRKFHVSSSDRKWAYDVLHARAIEFLLAREILTIEFANDSIMVYRNTTFRVDQFTTAAETARGLLDLLPDYVKQQQRLNGGSGE